jgi:hypothetical protein
MKHTNWTKIQSKKIDDMDELSCFNVDSSGKYIFVGSKSGLLRVYSSHTFEAVTELYTISTFQINNIESIWY